MAGGSRNERVTVEKPSYSRKNGLKQKKTVYFQGPQIFPSNIVYLNRSGEDVDLSLSCFRGLPRPFFLGEGSKLDRPRLADNVGNDAVRNCSK